MVIVGQSAQKSLLGKQLDRRRLLRFSTGILGMVALALLVAACGDDDGADDVADDEAVAQATDDDSDSEVELPDGLPDDLPLPGQFRVQTDQSGDTEDGREIVLIVFGEGELDEFIDEMGDAIHANYDVEDEFVEDGESGRWNFSDEQWVSARVNVEEYMPNPDLISVTFDMQDH